MVSFMEHSSQPTSKLVFNLVIFGGALVVLAWALQSVTQQFN
jgi:hypothetical protein